MLVQPSGGVPGGESVSESSACGVWWVFMIPIRRTRTNLGDPYGPVKCYAEIAQDKPRAKVIAATSPPTDVPSIPIQLHRFEFLPERL